MTMRFGFETRNHSIFGCSRWDGQKPLAASRVMFSLMDSARSTPMGPCTPW